MLIKKTERTFIKKLKTNYDNGWCDKTHDALIKRTRLSILFIPVYTKDEMI
jgi:hypothetical protein